MNKSLHTNVLIVGGGIVGCAIAYELSKYKIDVLLVEKNTDVATGTTKANSGILHAGFDPDPTSLKGKTNARGNFLYHQLEKLLQLEIRWTGSLVVAKTEEEIETLKVLLQRGKENKVPDLKIIYGQEIFALEPNLDKNIKAALYAPTAGVISPFTAAISFAECAMQNGARVLLNCEVLDFDIKNDKITAANTSYGKITADYVINAAGLYADNISRFAGDDSFKITPRRGEYLLFDHSCSKDLVSSIVFPTPNKLGKGILVCSTYNGETFIGPNAENIDDKQDVDTKSENINFIIQTAKNIVPNIPVNAAITQFAGLRAISNTDDFVIKQSPTVKGLIHAAGMQSPGLTSAPCIAELICQELLSAGCKLEKKENFKQDLPQKIFFRKLSDEQKADLISKNPIYGRIICRCEMISEGEIIDAIKSPLGAKTLDGVKRRVRAGLGRCQGGFCMPRVTALLARELGIPLTDIVKEGTKSTIFCAKHTEDEL